MSEETIVRHCSPTLAGIKTGNLFTCPYESEDEILKDIRGLNQLLVPKGIRVLPLRFHKQRALIYIYRPKKLELDLENHSACALLRELGYVCEYPDKCVVQIADKLKSCSEFPHEIGLFLGYPPEDVRGFIENKADCAKCVGCWKVYGDEHRAKVIDAKYKKCTAVYCKQWAKGKSIERLTVAV